jgi:hypothetical protein
VNGFAQTDPTPTPTPGGGGGGPVDVHIDLSGLAALIWQTLIDHIADVGNAIWTPLSLWLASGIHGAAVAIWNATFGAMANFVGQLPPELTYDNSAYKAIATDPLPVAVGGATLALVLLGLRTLLGSMVGRDHVITHVTGRLIPAVLLALAYPVLIVRAVQLINVAAGAVGAQGAVNALADVAEDPSRIATNAALLLLWVLLLWFGLRLLLRVAYSLIRFTVALVFGPVAIILWAIPQTEWVTWFWLRELVGWGTTPLLVTVALAIAVPMATGHSGDLVAIAFGIAGFQAAHDLVGVLSYARGGNHGGPLGYVRMAAGAAHGGGVGVAAASIPANRMTTLADQYGFN